MKILLLICVSLLLAACGGGSHSSPAAGAGSAPASGPAKLKVVVDGKDYSFEIKDAVGNNDMVRLSSAKTGKSELVAQHRFFLTTYPIDEVVHKALTKQGETRVMIEIDSEAGTDLKSLPKVGNYPVGMGENAFNGVNFYTFDGGQAKAILSSTINSVTRTGAVKITAVEGNTVKGEIDVSIGDKIIVSGPFTAKFRA